MYKFNLEPKEVPEVDTTYREICTKLPNPNTLDVIKKCIKNEPESMNDQLPVVWEGYCDGIVTDLDNFWIDLTSGIFVLNTGNPPQIIPSVSMDVPMHSYYYPQEHRANLTEKLLSITPNSLDKVLLLTTGSEAVEAAIKMAIKHTGRDRLATIEGQFHGKTMGAASVGGKRANKEWIPLNYYDMFDESFSLDDLYSNIDLMPKLYAGIIIEPYQGWSGRFYDKKEMQRVVRFCKEHGILVIFDEVQSGFGRTGKMWGFEHYEVEPDIIIAGKAISGGLPLSAVITREEIANCSNDFNSTHGANPVCCASAAANIDYLLEHDLVNESARKGKILKRHLLSWQKELPDTIGEVNFAGMMGAAFVKGENPIELADRIIERAYEKGVLMIRTQSGTLKFGAPLTIEDEAFEEALEVVAESIKEICNV